MADRQPEVRIRAGGDQRQIRAVLRDGLAVPLHPHVGAAEHQLCKGIARVLREHLAQNRQGIRKTPLADRRIGRPQTIEDGDEVLRIRPWAAHPSRGVQPGRLGACADVSKRREPIERVPIDAARGERVGAAPLQLVERATAVLAQSAGARRTGSAARLDRPSGRTVPAAAHQSASNGRHVPRTAATSSCRARVARRLGVDRRSLVFGAAVDEGHEASTMRRLERARAKQLNQRRRHIGQPHRLVGDPPGR